MKNILLKNDSEMYGYKFKLSDYDFNLRFTILNINEL